MASGERCTRKLGSMLGKKTLETYFDRLWPVHRSITGAGFEESLGILSELIPLKKHYWKSGERVHDWVIPDEWNLTSGVIYNTETGEDILSTEDSWLHVVGYSVATRGMLPWHQLREHVHTLPELPDAVPYITHYYGPPQWGYCMSHRQYLEMDKSPDTKYCYEIQATLAPGYLIAGSLLIPGALSGDEIMLSTYLCHPTANDGLSGALVLAGVYQKLKDMNLKHTLRFYVGPENIGAAAYLARFGLHGVVAGLVLTCLGYGTPFTYKRSRRGDSLIDRAATHVLSKYAFVDYKDFFPDGSDERQFCSPGYNLPIGVLMRHGYWGYKEYHTSLDNKNLINFDTILESIDTVVDIVLAVDEGSRKYTSTVQYGTPMFSRRGDDKLYESTMRLNSFYRGEGHRRAMLNMINWSDGEHDLLYIAEKCECQVADLLPLVDILLKKGYIT